MKKLFIILATLTMASTAMATGKLVLQNNFYDFGKSEDIYKPMIGFAVYEKLMSNTHFNSWIGGGSTPMEESDDVRWLVAKAQLDIQIKKVTVSPGFQYKHIFGDDDSLAKDIQMPFFALSYNLW